MDVAILKEAMEIKKVKDSEDQSETIFSFANQKPSVQETLKFNSLEVSEAPLTSPEEINSFESARQVFLRAVSRLELSKRTFPLDGSSAPSCVV